MFHCTSANATRVLLWKSYPYMENMRKGHPHTLGDMKIMSNETCSHLKVQQHRRGHLLSMNLQHVGLANSFDSRGKLRARRFFQSLKVECTQYGNCVQVAFTILGGQQFSGGFKKSQKKLWRLPQPESAPPTSLWGSR